MKVIAQSYTKKVQSYSEISLCVTFRFFVQLCGTADLIKIKN
jgi:hypothetical protein